MLVLPHCNHSLGVRTGTAEIEGAPVRGNTRSQAAATVERANHPPDMTRLMTRRDVTVPNYPAAPLERIGPTPVLPAHPIHPPSTLVDVT